MACVRAHVRAQAILRPGRLDAHIRVGLPSEAQRLALLPRLFSGTPVRAGEVSFPDLARRTEGCSLAHLSALCREAAMGALRESLDSSHVCGRHVELALEQLGALQSHG